MSEIYDVHVYNSVIFRCVFNIDMYINVTRITCHVGYIYIYIYIYLYNIPHAVMICKVQVCIGKTAGRKRL